MKKKEPFSQVTTSTRNVSVWSGARNINTWLLFFQYACCLGAVLTVNNAAALYYRDVFEASTEKAAAIASVIGMLNLFSRGLGGICTDKISCKFGMKGRLWLQATLLFIEGFLIFAFIHAKNLALSIFLLLLFALSAQMAAGTSYGIAPYINPNAAGIVTGIVGAGGNVGAICFGLSIPEVTSILSDGAEG
jgi:MFS transporter, NNP family, nitrate/nitrite transporter